MFAEWEYLLEKEKGIYIWFCKFLEECYNVVWFVKMFANNYTICQFFLYDLFGNQQ